MLAVLGLLLVCYVRPQFIKFDSVLSINQSAIGEFHQQVREAFSFSSAPKLKFQKDDVITNYLDLNIAINFDFEMVVSKTSSSVKDILTKMNEMWFI